MEISCACAKLVTKQTEWYWYGLFVSMRDFSAFKTFSSEAITHTKAPFSSKILALGLCWINSYSGEPLQYAASFCSQTWKIGMNH